MYDVGARALRDAWHMDRETIRHQETLLLRLLGKETEWALLGTASEKRVQIEVQRFIVTNRTREFSATELLAIPK